MKTLFTSFFLLALATAATHAQGDAAKTADGKKAAEPVKAIAVVRPTEGNKAQGTVTFTEQGDGVRVEGTIAGLTPGKHGFHVHEFGDISALDAMSAGGHFNPDMHPHGAPDAEKRHAGDLGNLTADESGTAKVNYVDKHLMLHGEHTIVGRSVIVHAKEDDLKSQPSGEAGARVGAGVIGVAKVDKEKK